jgi:hypothetical protein
MIYEEGTATLTGGTLVDSYLEGTNCGALVEIERKILIEEHGDIA